ncbi:MAG: radical SAM protein [Limnospira sp. PMC 1291.21]|uniref:Radical SAM core domain-containing protein n=1 Tax=Limnospira indica PCC 8005 TaxID=376219 RepID=A0A9P1KJV5_9CYAN|nr:MULTISPECIES: radical SAM protein [Limnospira]MDT9179385.1 radical SAM protein [Limnospira sp. PMC 1238.20]MDT9194601.1 radical SAM protein [Limnospira sp. PMC 1245.20]MDT9204686.1 radical SAM protein [Limnospira sp. PMC 1243.20]MDT9209731.1 radical SAM protein [Limnospira sp. PMC 1252.20]MDT9215167.1 radical SAM protein [Limnospira sp. PMC 1256.20]
MKSPYKNINEVHIEITNMCNLSCTYCYAETLLPDKQIKNLFTNELYRDTITKMLLESKSDFLDIVFHGGEPLLHTPEWFEEACTFATSKANQLGKKVYFSMQSNLTLLKNAHVESFKKHQVKVGVSLDGDKETHNAMRGNFGVTVANMKKLQDAGLFGGVIVVISHHNWNKIPLFFKQMEELGIRIFHMNIASSVGRGNSMELLGTEKTFRAFKDCVDCMLKYKGEIVDTRMIKKLQQFINPPQSTEETFQQLRCDNLFCHAGVTMIAVQNDGNVFPCGCAGSSGNMKNFKLDNFRDTRETNPVDYFELLKKFHTKKEKYYNECVHCPAKFVCEHGCPAFDHTDPETPENTCLATKQLYSYLQTIDRSLIVELISIHESKSRALV